VLVARVAVQQLCVQGPFTHVQEALQHENQLVKVECTGQATFTHTWHMDHTIYSYYYVVHVYYHEVLTWAGWVAFIEMHATPHGLHAMTLA
jgi:hypothetical protein